MDKMEPQEVEQNLAAFPEWSQVGDTLQRTFNFDDFDGAMGFVGRIADLARELEHHPNIMIRYNKVTLTLSTHKAGGLTEKDFEFARAAHGCLPATHEA